jgi:hypothetical protein
MYHDFVNNTDLWYEYVWITLNNTENEEQTEPLKTTVRTNATGGAKNVTLKMLAFCTEDPNYVPEFSETYKIELQFLVAIFIFLFVRHLN